MNMGHLSLHYRAAVGFGVRVTLDGTIMASEKSCPDLMSLAVHEFRSPASVVSGYLHMLQRDTSQPLTDRQRKMIDEAENGCRRIVGLIGELSDIGKLDDGLVKLDRQRIDVLSLVAEVAEHVH